MINSPDLLEGKISHKRVGGVAPVSTILRAYFGVVQPLLPDLQGNQNESSHVQELSKLPPHLSRTFALLMMSHSRPSSSIDTASVLQAGRNEVEIRWKHRVIAKS